MQGVIYSKDECCSILLIDNEWIIMFSSFMGMSPKLTGEKLAQGQSEPEVIDIFSPPETVLNPVLGRDSPMGKPLIPSTPVP